MGTVIAKTSAVNCCLLTIFSNLFVWVIGIIISLTLGKNDSQYDIESLGLATNGVKLVGFILCTLGLLVYNHVITFCEADSKELFDNYESIGE